MTNKLVLLSCCVLFKSGWNCSIWNSIVSIIQMNKNMKENYFSKIGKKNAFTHYLQGLIATLVFYDTFELARLANPPIPWLPSELLF